MERHHTHLLSSNSSLDHSYKFDKNSVIKCDSVNDLVYNKYIDGKKNKIKTSEIISNIQKNGIDLNNMNLNQENDSNNFTYINKKENKIIIDQNKNSTENTKNKDENNIISNENEASNEKKLMKCKKTKEESVWKKKKQKKNHLK